MMHDHKEKGVTTDGIYPGGSVSLLVFGSYLDTNGLPKLHGINPQFFNKEYYNKQAPVWASYDGDTLFNDVEADTPSYRRLVPMAFAFGVLGGGLLFFGLRYLKLEIPGTRKEVAS